MQKTIRKLRRKAKIQIQKGEEPSPVNGRGYDA